ncbi:MAG: OmpA family protein [Pseudomonadota bacterium]
MTRTATTDRTRARWQRGEGTTEGGARRVRPAAALRAALRIGLGAMALLLAAAPAAEAQLTAEEIKERFSRHRGFSLAPVTQPEAKKAEPEPTRGASTGSSTSSGTSTETTTATRSPGAEVATPKPPKSKTTSQPAGTPEAKVEYVALPSDVQVNLQINFDFDSAVLRESERRKLDAVCTAMRDSDVSVFHIFGHTDTSGAAGYNLTLSQLRADEVRRYLVRDCGIDGSRLKAIGVGEDHPLEAVAPRAPENRRVEFQAVS